MNCIHSAPGAASTIARDSHRCRVNVPSSRPWVGRVMLLALLAGCATAPRPLLFVSGPDPVYPDAARAEGIEGQVTVRYDVSAEGTVINPQVIQAEPGGVFDQAALDAVSRWRFRPPVIDGQNVALRGRVSTLQFRLTEGDPYAGY